MFAEGPSVVRGERNYFRGQNEENIREREGEVMIVLLMLRG